jgi:integrase
MTCATIFCSCARRRRSRFRLSTSPCTRCASSSIHTLQRDWAIFDLLRVNRPQALPVVLSTTEVRAVLGGVRHPVRRMALATIYALGLRLGEGLGLESDHIDGERLLVWVRDGKGAKDRGVPLPRPILARAARSFALRARLLDPTEGRADASSTTVVSCSTTTAPSASGFIRSHALVLQGSAEACARATARGARRPRTARRRTPTRADPHAMNSNFSGGGAPSVKTLRNLKMSAWMQ